VPDVANRIVEQRRPDFVERLFLSARARAESKHRLTAGFPGTHPCAHILLGLLIEVELQLLVESALERATPEHRSHPSPGVHYASVHGVHLCRVAPRTRFTARDIRCHCASSSLKCRR